MGGLGVLLAVSLHSLTDFSLHKPANAFLLAIILGLAFRAVYGRDKSLLKDEIGAPPRPTSAGMTKAVVGNGGKIGPYFRVNKGRGFSALFILLGFSICL